MRYLIAGGAGFIGFHLSQRLLSQGHDVLVVDDLSSGSHANILALRLAHPRAFFEFQHGDVRNARLPERSYDVIYHLASAASPVDYLRRPLETLEVGSAGTRNLLELARRTGARFVLASTSEVYGDPAVHPQPESYWGNVNPIGPRSVYDEAKRYAEAYTCAYAEVHGLSVRIARIFNTYGPRMRPTDGRVISTFIDQAMRNVALTIQGDGLQTRSYCYVDDLVDGLLRLTRSAVSGPVNLGNPEEYTVLETARIILELTGSSSALEFVPAMNDDPRRRRPDIARASSLLDWRPRIGLREGLGRMIAEFSAANGRPQTAKPASQLDGAGATSRFPRRGTSAPGIARLRAPGKS